MNRSRRGLFALAMAIAFSQGCAGLPKLSTLNGKRGSKSTARSEESFTARLNQARALEKSGDLEKASKAYQRIAENFPKRHEPIHRLAVVADQKEQFTTAQGLYTRAIQLSPRNAQLFNDLGYCFYLQGKLTKAERALQKAVRLESGNSRFRNNLGMVLGNLGNVEAAFDEFAKGGSEADAYYNVAFIYATKDDNESARQCFELALDADPSHAKARKALESFVRAENGELPDEVAFDDQGRPLTRYREGDQGVAPAAFQPGIPANRNAGAATRALHSRSRGLLNRHRSSQRNADGQPDSPSAQAFGAAPMADPRAQTPFNSPATGASVPTYGPAMAPGQVAR